ncbi:hypothetical protein Tco_1395815 [Tanacetum coccineum]
MRVRAKDVVSIAQCVSKMRGASRYDFVDSQGGCGKGRRGEAARDVAKLLPVFILSEKLHSAISQFDQLRGVRFQDAINRAMPRKKPGRAKTSIDTYYFGNCLESREPTSSKTINHGEIPAEPMKVQQHLLDDETRTLQVSSNDYSVFDSMLIRGSDTI